MNHTISQSEAARPTIAAMRTRALIIGGIGVVGLVVGAVVDVEQFFHSYLIGFVFWTMIALGALGLKMLHNMVSGAWGFVIRRFLEAAIRTLPLLLVLFVPIAFGMHYLYEWTHQDVVAADAVLRHKSVYLNTPFFLIRTAIYFALWIGIGFWVNRLNEKQENLGPNEPPLTRKLQSTSAFGLVALVISATLASVDWMMSLEPHWFSTIYGMLFVVGATLGSLALMTAMLVRFATFEPISGIIRQRMFHDLGNLMFALTMLWAYISLSQFLIIWSGNLAEETPWYAARLNGGWGVIGWTLVTLHFAVPFLLLLSRKNKRNAKILGGIAIFMLVMRAVDLLWLIVPSFRHGNEHFTFGLSWLDIVAPIAIGGIWFAYFSWQLQGRSLLPVNDPRLPDALERIAHGDEYETEAATRRLHSEYDITEGHKHG